MAHPLPPIGEIREKVRLFNASMEYRALDSLTHRVFSGGFSAERIEERVYVIGKLWDAVQPFSDRSADALCWNLQKAAPQIGRVLGGLSPGVLEDQPERVVGAAEELLPLFSADRTYYVFATKFLHWCARDHFPMVDSNARRAINSFQTRWHPRPKRKDLIAKMTPSGEDARLRDYGKVVRFYGGLIRGLSKPQQDSLSEADATCGVSNSLLRILDKYFWMKGREA